MPCTLAGRQNAVMTRQRQVATRHVAQVSRTNEAYADLDRGLVRGADDATNHLLNLVPLPPQAKRECALYEHVQHDAQAPYVRCVALVLSRREHLMWQRDPQE